MAMFIAVIISLSVGACLGAVALGICASSRDPAASVAPLPEAGGSWAGSLPGSLALASPLAEPSSPAKFPATGRGLNKDYYCADDVAVTITDHEVWLDVDADKLTRVKRIKRLVVNDWRSTTTPQREVTVLSQRNHSPSLESKTTD